jgi:hypothetical protein
LLTQIITGSFVTGGGTDGTVMEKMDVDDDAVVDLSVKYVHWYLSHHTVVRNGGSKDICGTHSVFGYDGFVKNLFLL